MKHVITRLTGNDIEGVSFTDEKYKDSTMVYVKNSKMIELPPDITTLKSIRQLTLIDCENLTRLPDNIGDLTSLIILHITNCPSLINLPCSIGKLEKLQTLSLGETGIESLPETVGQLHRLEELSISGKSFKYLPDSICNMGARGIKISITYTSLRKIPDKIAEIWYLQRLYLMHNKIDKIPYQVFMADGNLNGIDLTGNVGGAADLWGEISIADVKRKLETDEWKQGRDIEFGDEEAEVEMIAMIKEVLEEDETNEYRDL